MYYCHNSNLEFSICMAYNVLYLQMFSSFYMCTEYKKSIQEGIPMREVKNLTFKVNELLKISVLMQLTERCLSSPDLTEGGNPLLQRC